MCAESLTPSQNQLMSAVELHHDQLVDAPIGAAFDCTVYDPLPGVLGSWRVGSLLRKPDAMG